MSNTVVTIGLIVLGVAIGLGFGYLIARLAIARRHERDGVSAEDVVDQRPPRGPADSRQGRGGGPGQGRDLPRARRGGPRAPAGRSLQPRDPPRPSGGDPRAARVATWPSGSRCSSTARRSSTTPGARWSGSRRRHAPGWNRIAGIDAKAAKDELLAQVEARGAARGDDPGPRSGDKGTRGSRPAGPPHPGHRHPAPGVGGGHRDRRCRSIAAPLRRHEGADHRA